MIILFYGGVDMSWAQYILKYQTESRASISIANFHELFGDWLVKVCHLVYTIDPLEIRDSRAMYTRYCGVRFLAELSTYNYRITSNRQN